MPPVLRKAVLSAHLTVSVGWIGAVITYLALGAAAASSDSGQTIRSAWIAMELTGWFVIVPLALASLLSGIAMALGTRWGLVRHYWVILSLLLTVFAVAVLLLHMPSVSADADFARSADPAGLRSLRSDLFHPSVGLLVLLAVQVLNLYKPKGMTRYGRRKQASER